MPIQLIETKIHKSHLYSEHSENVNLEDAKAPGLSDRESIHISNMDRLTIAESRELSLSSKSYFQSARSIAEVAKERFGDLVKAVVDIKRGVMVIGAELHSDEEALLIEQGSEQQDLWGINLYPDKSSQDWIEFDSVINIRPAQGNRSRGVNDLQTQKMIKEIISQLVHDS